MIDIDISIKNGWFRDCITPEDAAFIKHLVNRSQLEYIEADHSTGGPTRQVRFFLCEADFEDLSFLEEELKEMMSVDQTIQNEITATARNYSWVGKTK